MPEGRIGGHEEAVDRRPLGDRPDEGVVLRPAERIVEVDDDRHPHARGGQPFQPLGRIAQERRGGTHEDLVRVVIERDDGWRGTPAGRLMPQVLEEIGVASMDPVEHPHDEEQATMFRPEQLSC